MVPRAEGRYLKPVEEASGGTAHPQNPVERQRYLQRGTRTRVHLLGAHHQRGTCILDTMTQAEPGGYGNAADRLFASVSQINGDQSESPALRQHIRSLQCVLYIASATDPKNLSEPNTSGLSALRIESILGVQQGTKLLSPGGSRKQGVQNRGSPGSRNLTQRTSGDFSSDGGNGFFRVRSKTKFGLDLVPKKSYGGCHIRLIFAYNWMDVKCRPLSLNFMLNPRLASFGELAYRKPMRSSARRSTNQEWRCWT
jgi:hypothetical protein